MRSVARALTLLAVVVLSPAAIAQTQTMSFVSALGRDNFPCTRPFPCRTFAGAQAKTAPGGRILVLDTGDYGPVTITKSLTLEAPDGVYAEVAATNDDGITVNAGTGERVILRGLTVRGPGDAGIIALSFGELVVERCVVHGFTNSGIATLSPGSNAEIKDTIVRDCGGGIEAGLTAAGTEVMTIEHCQIENTRVGGAVSVAQGARVTVRDTSVSDNLFGFTAASVAGRAAELTIENSLASETHAGGSPTVVGGLGVSAFFGAVVRLSNTVLVNNDVGVYSDSLSTVYTFGNNKIHGNTQQIIGPGMTAVPQQ